MAQPKLTLALVERTYHKAVSDEAGIVQRWSKAAEDKKKAVSELGFPASSEEFLLNSAKSLSDEQIRNVAVGHRKVTKNHLRSLTSYRPSELVIASLQAAWEPYAELLLAAAGSLRGADFGELKPQLIKNGFERTILGFFLVDQRRRYFLQQTPKSIARLIATQRHFKGGLAVKRA